ncbi:hypothetical protein FRC04_003135 [Tulasnella sp. 424]|nr:hypothetical protein FRC04_003135 [Tulasnella sp. 424]
MVQQVNAFASEVTRVALEVGTMGVLGGQAQVEGVQGNLGPINNVQPETFNRPFQVEVQGEMLDPENTGKSMVRQPYTMTNQVMRVSFWKRA